MNFDPTYKATSGLPIPATAGDAARARFAKGKSRKGQPRFLGIDPERLAELTEKACRRIDECRADMGLHFGMPLAGEGTWAWERQIARIMYQGNMDHRRALGALFRENNWSINVPSRIIRMLAAQHAGDLIGSDPFCAVMPEKLDDPAAQKLARQTEKLVQDEITAANLRACLAESIRVALTEGERPLKVTYELDQTQFIGDAVVLVTSAKQLVTDADGNTLRDYLEGEPLSDAEQVTDDESGGEPVKTASGDYIFPHDEFIRFYVDQSGQPLGPVPDDSRLGSDGDGPTNPANGPSGSPAPTPPFPSPATAASPISPKAPITPISAAPPTGTSAPPMPPGAARIELRLKKEPSFALRQHPTYKLIKNLPQTITHRRGLNVAGLFCEDFLYPIKCPSLRDPSCDIIVHCYDEPLESLEARYRNIGYRNGCASFGETGPLSQQNQPIREAGETPNADSRKLVNVHETYFRTRVNDDDAHESWLFLVIDYQHRVPVYAEYLGNMKMKRPPFVLLRGVESEPGRAYGAGVYKRFADKNLAIDMWFNRAALKSSKSGSITFQHEDGWRAEYQGQQLIIGGTEVYKIPANASDQYGPNHPPVFRVNLNEMTDKEFELMEKLIQDGDLTFGVVNAADGAAADLNASGTATGVRNIERTGNILQRATEDLMTADLEELLELIGDTVLENLDEQSTQWIPGEESLAHLNRDHIRNLPRDERILLNKARGDENLALNQQASQIVQDYYAKPLWLRQKIRSFVIQQLKSLFVQDADQVIEDPSEEDITAEKQSQSGNTPPKESIHIALKDLAPLTPNERAQALALLGIQADPATNNN